MLNNFNNCKTDSNSNSKEVCLSGGIYCLGAPQMVSLHPIRTPG